MSGPINPIAVLDSQIAELRAFGDTGNVENLLEVRDVFAAAIEALRKIATSPRDESGCYYTNRANIRIAGAALARCGVEQ